MVRTCIVCHVSSKDNKENVSFHLFPKNEIKRNTWCEALSISKATPNQSVCSNHFDPGYYNFSYSRKMLKPSAVPSLNIHCNQYNMEKVETYKQQPPLPPQQSTMPPLVANCVTTPDKLIKHDGDKSINEDTDIKWPVKRRISRKERKKRLNAQMRLLVCPKSSLMVFSELFKDIPIHLQEHPLHNACMSYTATLEIDGQMYCGNDISMTQAKEKACEKFLRIMFEKKLSEKSEESPMNVEMEVVENGSLSKPKEPPQEDFPWSHFVSLAMYNLMNQWKIQPVESTVIKPQPKIVAMKKFPENPKNCNPIQLINQMKPVVKYIETISAKLPLLFQVNCVIDDIPFTGQGSTKKAAKKECCIASVKYFWQFDFHAIENN